MEPQPGSPALPPSPGTPSSPGSAKVTTPSEEMPAPDEPMEEATEQEPGRKSTSSSSSSPSSESSAESLSHVYVVELGDPLVSAPEDEQAIGSPAPTAEGKSDGWLMLEDEQAAAPVHGAEVKPDDRELPGVEQAAAPAVHSAETKPDDWATWPEPPPPAVDDSFSSDGNAGAALTGPTEALQVQTMPRLDGAAAGAGFDPQRIPESVFQPRTSMSQAEWSMASNESLFSIQSASDVVGPYAGSRSHFDFFYDEAMAAGGAAEADPKLPTVAEGTEPGELAVESKEFVVPGSAGSHASAGSADAKKTAVFRRHESGSGGSSSNFSFAFPILAPTSPKKKELVSTALYQPLEKECKQPPLQLEPPVSAFVEMMTEAERRGSTGCCCCGCCWFDCSWSTCCGWWRCCRCRPCSCCCCSCPSFCRCSWCLCS